MCSAHGDAGSAFSVSGVLPTKDFTDSRQSASPLPLSDICLSHTAAPGKFSFIPSVHLQVPQDSMCLWQLALSPWLSLAGCPCQFLVLPAWLLHSACLLSIRLQPLHRCRLLSSGSRSAHREWMEGMTGMRVLEGMDLSLGKARLP